MFEAKFEKASQLKKIVDAMKDLVNEANLECSSKGITLQAMDSSHVSLISLSLLRESFNHYRCDRNISIGLNLANLTRILKCAANDDSVVMKAQDEGRAIEFTFEGDEGERISEFELNMMDIESEHLGIPETDYKCVVSMPSGEFQRIIRDIGTLGDAITIGVNKEGIRFFVKGDVGNGNILRKQSSKAQSSSRMEEDDGEDKKPKKTKKAASEESDNDHGKTSITVDEPVELKFALRYLSHFTKATPLSENVYLHLSENVPLMVEYRIEGDMGSIQFYLAPRIEE